MNPIYPSDAWDLLKSRLSGERRERMERVAAHRTEQLRLVIQDVHDPHNISACMRSAEAFGLMHCDVVNLKHSFKKPSGAARGAAGWLCLKKWKSVSECVQELRAEGYKIAAGYPAQEAQSIHSMPVREKIAVIFGNEHDGVSGEWLPHIDYKFTIPMVGMVESLNISVSAALTMFELRRRFLESMSPEAFYISPSRQRHLLNEWVCHKIPSYQLELERLRDRPQPR